MAGNDGGGAVTITIVFVGVGYFSALTAGTIALIAAVGAVLLPIVAVGITLLGLYIYMCYFGEAVRSGNWHWAFDIVAAPAVAFGVVLLAPAVAQSVWLLTLGNLKALTESQNFVLILLAIPFGIALAYSVFAAPVYSVLLMGSDSSVPMRLVSYVCFAWTASYWGLIAIAVSAGGLDTWLTNEGLL